MRRLATSRSRRSAFTLVELLVVIGIILTLAATTLFALYGTMEDARARRTQSQITRIHELLLTRWEEYRSRPVPMRLSAGVRPTDAAQIRLAVLREIMRMEVPDRKSDVADGVGPIYVNGSQFPVTLAGNPLTPAAPALWNSYDRFVADKWGPNWRAIAEPNGWTRRHQGAECLYMILANMRFSGDSALDFFKQNEIGDVDGDLMPEILDAWGNPIEFLRWAPGFSAQPGFDNEWGVAGVDDDNDGVVDNSTEVLWVGSDDFVSLSDLQSRDVTQSADAFDVLRVDWRWRDVKMNGDPIFTNDPFALYPLVFSAGRDQVYDIVTDLDASVFTSPTILRYRLTDRPNPAGGMPARVPYPNDPYVNVGISFQIGSPADLDGDNVQNARDNIHNHLIEAR